MTTKVTMPQLGESVVEGTVGRWLVKEGEAVAKDQPLLEVLTDKADTEVPSPVAGVVVKIHAAVDDVLTAFPEVSVEEMNHSPPSWCDPEHEMVGIVQANKTRLCLVPDAVAPAAAAVVVDRDDHQTALGVGRVDRLQKPEVALGIGRVRPPEGQDYPLFLVVLERHRFACVGFQSKGRRWLLEFDPCAARRTQSQKASRQS